MIFYQFSTIGGLMIDIRPYQDILTANVINDGIEKPLCEKVLLADANKNYKMRDAILGFDFHNPNWDGFVVNQKLKAILDEYKIIEHTRFSLIVEYKHQQYPYTILHFDRPKLLHQYRHEAIDYTASSFVNEKKKRVAIYDFEGYENAPDSLYTIELCVRKEGIEYDLQPDYLSSFGHQSLYYVISERLKLRLEKEKMTGLLWDQSFTATNARLKIV